MQFLAAMQNNHETSELAIESIPSLDLQDLAAVVGGKDNPIPQGGDGGQEPKWKEQPGLPPPKWAGGGTNPFPGQPIDLEDEKPDPPVQQPGAQGGGLNFQPWLFPNFIL